MPRSFHAARRHDRDPVFLLTSVEAAAAPTRRLDAQRGLGVRRIALSANDDSDDVAIFHAS